MCTNTCTRKQVYPPAVLTVGVLVLAEPMARARRVTTKAKYVFSDNEDDEDVEMFDEGDSDFAA